MKQKLVTRSFGLMSAFLCGCTALVWPQTSPVALSPSEISPSAETSIEPNGAAPFYKTPNGPPDPLPPFHAPLELTGSFASNGQNAPNLSEVITPIKAPRPLVIAIYTGIGAPAGSIKTVETRARMLRGAKVTRLRADDFTTADLSKYDIVVFSGGMSSTQAQGLGEAGRANVRKYVYNGGSYLGICAGAYLATCGYDWSLGILNGTVVAPTRWMRGAAFLELELSDHGRSIFGDTKNKFFVRYHNGPIIEPAHKSDLPPYTVETYFRTEVDCYHAPVGIQVNSPAVITATYGKGKVLTISPHPESTKGLENFVPRALIWLGDKTN